jgi:hypothetical protein
MPKHRRVICMVNSGLPRVILDAIKKAEAEGVVVRHGFVPIPPNVKPGAMQSSRTTDESGKRPYEVIFSSQSAAHNFHHEHDFLLPCDTRIVLNTSGQAVMSFHA